MPEPKTKTVEKTQSTEEILSEVERLEGLKAEAIERLIKEIEDRVELLKKLGHAFNDKPKEVKKRKRATREEMAARKAAEAAAKGES